MPLLRPDQTVIIDLPEYTRLRNTSRTDGRENSAMPSLRQLSRTSSSTSVSSVLSPAVSTTISIGRPSGRRRKPRESRLVSPIESSSALAALTSNLVHAVAEFRPEERTALQHGVARFLGEAEVDDLVDLVPVDPQRQRAPEPHVAHQRAPDRIVDVEVRVERHLRADALLPEQDAIVVAFRVLLEERVVVEAQVARLQIDVAGAGLGRYQLAVGDVDDDAVDVGKLPARLVDAMEVRVAHEHEARRRQGRRVDPRLQRRQIRIVEAELLVLLLVVPGPAAGSGRLRLRLRLVETDVLRMELAQVVRRPVDVQRTRTRELRQELRIRLVPGEAHRGLAQHLEAGTAVAHLQHLRQAERRQVGIVGDILPEVAEIRGRERLPVRPAVAGAQVQREDAAVDVLDALEDVRDEVQLLVVADEARVAVDDHHPDVAVLREQRAQLAAIAPDRPVAAVDVDDQRHARQPLRHRRQLAVLDVGLEQRRLLGAGPSGDQQAGRERAGEPGKAAHHAVSLSSLPPVCIRTRWPSPTSISSPALVGRPAVRRAPLLRTARRAVEHRGEIELALQIRVGHGREQAQRVGMERIREQHFARRDLDDAAAAHHGDLVGDVVDDGEIVRNEEVREPELGLQVLQQVQDLRLDRDVERGYGLVAEHEIGLERERAGDADALALPARKAVRIPVEEARVQPDQAHQLLRHFGPVVGVADLVDDQRLAQDVEHRHPRAQRSERILEDVLHAAPEAHQGLGAGAHDVDHRAAVVEQHLAAVGLERAHDHLGQRGLAATALADEAEAFAARDGEAHVVDRPEGRPLALAEESAAALLERLGDAADVEMDRRGVGRPRLRLLHQRSGVVVDRAHRNEPLAGLHVEVGDGMQQRAQVGMGRPLVQRLDGALLHHATFVEDDHFLRQVGDDAQIVRDDEHGHVELGLQFLDQGEDLRLDGHVERRGRFVGDEQRRAADERHRDHRPLPQAAGELERIALQRARRVGEAHQAQHFLGPGHALLVAHPMMQEEGFAHLVADGVQRRQRHHRLLEDHRDVAAADLAQRDAVGLELGDVARGLVRVRAPRRGSCRR